MTDPTVRCAQWRELGGALDTLNRASTQVQLGDLEAASMLIGDVRTYLGALALLLADDPDVVGYAALLGHVLTPPRSAAEAAYIERVHRAES